MIKPSNDTITLLFGATTYPYTVDHPHIGVDFSPSPDSTIYAPEGGKVTLTLNDPQMGNAVHIWIDNRHHAFCHMQEFFVTDGQAVNQGDKLGIMGHTGYVVPPGPDGTHLHWAVAVDNTLIDPLSLVITEENNTMNPNDGDVDNAYMQSDGRKATDQEKQLYTAKAWSAPDGLYYGKIRVDFGNTQTWLTEARAANDPKLVALATAFKAYLGS
jgi:hypothetical protein